MCLAADFLSCAFDYTSAKFITYSEIPENQSYLNWTTLMRYRSDVEDNEIPVIESTEQQLTTLDNDDMRFVNRESIALIWCDVQVDERNEAFVNDVQQTKAILRELNDFVHFCSNETDCVAHVKTFKTETIILIISGSYASEKLLDDMHTLRHVDTIFIFYMEKSKYEASPVLQNPKYTKIGGIFDEQESLKRNIIKAVRAIERQSAIFALYDSKKQKTARNIDRENGSFLWLQLIKEVIQQMSITIETPGSANVRDSTSKQEMLNICRAYYRGNKREMKNIDEFEQTYTANQAIHWYTRNSFIFKLINKALRTEDVEALYNYRFYVVDLCACLAENCDLLREYACSSPSDKLKLYSGRKLSREEIQRLKDSEGQLISMNAFFSTSRNKNVAEVFAGIGNVSVALQELESVIFEIEVDLVSDQHVVLADISFYSAFKDEEEILFDLATVFEIEAMTCIDTDVPSDRVWTCRMKTSSRSSVVAQDYIQFQREQIKKHNDIVIVFGSLLYDMGAWSKAKAYCQRLLSQMPCNAHVLFELGRAHYGLCEFEQALECFAQAFTLSMADKPPSLAHAATIQCYIGHVRRLQSTYHSALISYEDSLEKYKQAGMDNQVPIANVLSGIGCVHDNLGDSALALQYFREAFEITIQLTPADHQDVIVCYARISLALSHMGEYDEALRSAEIALDIGKRILPKKSATFSTILNNIGKLLYKKGDYKQALARHLEDLDIDRDVLTHGNMYDLAIRYNNIGKIFYRTGKYSEAYEQYEKALIIHQKTLPNDHVYIAYTLKNMGELFLAQDKLDQSTDYLHHALEMYERIFSDNLLHPEKAKCIYLIGQLYEARLDHQTAISFYRQAHSIWKSVLVAQHPDLTLSPRKMSQLFWKLLRRSIRQK
ncbi:unnamed protein product [Adineta ricciae]|uniref:NAD(P)(+)--arginine ADP-ribosyltransferase n=1 Tax=Adineta ricciae TaxID=249248 RepID=A0A813TJP3_ADIRI|nr:unnamed protein product [Adineta ricciae]CAF1380050.1 unnamed protein product [Adineta ricciae]